MSLIKLVLVSRGKDGIANEAWETEEEKGEDKRGRKKNARASQTRQGREKNMKQERKKEKHDTVFNFNRAKRGKK